MYCRGCGRPARRSAPRCRRAAAAGDEITLYRLSASRSSRRSSANRPVRSNLRCLGAPADRCDSEQCVTVESQFYRSFHPYLPVTTPFDNLFESLTRARQGARRFSGARSRSRRLHRSTRDEHVISVLTTRVLNATSTECIIFRAHPSHARRPHKQAQQLSELKLALLAPRATASCDFDAVMSTPLFRDLAMVVLILRVPL